MELISIEAQSERALIVPDFGFQCFRYQVGGLDVIMGPADPSEWNDHPFRSGIPVLFPWPGRIADGRFSYRGREIRLPINDPTHNCAIHGLVWNRAFGVWRKGPFYISGRFDSRTDRDLSELWPFPFVLSLDYEIGHGLRLKVRAENVGDSPMPMGFGTHPYLSAPLSPESDRASMTIEAASVESRWELDARLLPSSHRTVSPEGRLDLRKPVTLGNGSYDNPFRRDSANPLVGRIIDPKTHLATEVRGSGNYSNVVVYAVDPKPFVAIEPYTCAPDAFNLAAQGIESGVIELQPGARFEASVEIRVSAP